MPVWPGGMSHCVPSDKHLSKAGLGVTVVHQRSSTVGVVAIAVLTLGNALLWALARPPGQPTARYVGEFLGAEAVLLFSISLVLATLLTFIERAFGGLDRVALWHRGVAIAGVLLMVVHPTVAGTTPTTDPSSLALNLGHVAMVGLVLLALWAVAPSLRAARWPGPIQRLARISYERWLTGHRLTGLFVAAAVVHGLLIDPVLAASTVLKVTYLAVGTVGIAAYAYRELVARFVIPVYDYTVTDVQRPNETTVDVFLEPVGRPLAFSPGQFVFLAFGGDNGWQRHPFSVASAPTDQRLEVSIKAVGDYTRDLHDQLQPGTPAKAAGPFGGFDYTKGGHHQVWVAGGMGITPFMSWIRAMDASFDREVWFFYTVNQEAEALYLDEIRTAAAAHPTLHPQLVDSTRDGYLTAEKALADLPAGADPWVYMCGPPAMTSALADGFHQRGIPSNRIRWEQFNIR